MPDFATGRVGKGRLLLALLLGHLAAAQAVSVSLMLSVFAFDAWTGDLGPPALHTARGMAEAVVSFPILIVMIGLFAAVVMLPLSLVTAPFTLWAAGALRTGPWTTAALGALVGALDGCLLLVFDLPSLTDGRPLVSLILSSSTFYVAAGVVAGATYGWVVWRLCIRPRTRGAVAR